MTRIENIDIKSKIHGDTILFFDMDGTLIDTDFANFLSYKEAVHSLDKYKVEISHMPNNRISRSSLKTMIPNLTDEDYIRIIQHKEKNYKNYLDQTKLNKQVADILFNYYETNKTVLVTNCREDRALLMLEHYNLRNKFDHLFFRQVATDEKRVNKYQNATKYLNISTQYVLLFENERDEIEDAMLSGILFSNIITI